MVQLVKPIKNRSNMDFMSWANMMRIGKIGKNFSFFRITFYFSDVLKNEQHPRNQ